MHGWISGLVVIIMKVMDHVLELYFIRTMCFKKKSLQQIWWSEVSFTYRVAVRFRSIA